MKLILCLDEGYGMMFNHRRQSKDSAVYEDISRMVQKDAIALSPYTYKYFGNGLPGTKIREKPEQEAEIGEYCFLEDCVEVEDRCYAQSLLDRAEQVVIYHWNRRYPTDQRFPMDLLTEQLILVSRIEFPGSSHEKITKEIYQKEEKRNETYDEERG